ncbi:MAG TPA: secretin and TonB N-terminal domain-containing protein, partial [Dysgonamonadaceae bacterium]|nr:secretin and TonB N-terminal domain-containing protein [Dysgonamonadaceae bacterium]
MNKNNSTGNCLTEKLPIKQFLRIMRISIILLFTCVFCSMAESAFTQNAKVTLNKRNASLKEVLNEIESQTDYLFIYNDEVNANKKISVNAKSERVADVLNAILKGSDIRYSMEGNHIILFVKSEEEFAKEAEFLVSQQQKKTITGRVVDVNGEPIIGANIVEVGTTNGTVT